MKFHSTSQKSEMLSACNKQARSPSAPGLAVVGVLVPGAAALVIGTMADVDAIDVLAVAPVVADFAGFSFVVVKNAFRVPCLFLPSAMAMQRIMTYRGLACPNRVGLSLHRNTGTVVN